MYDTFVCIQSSKVELALKQLYTHLANGINQEKKRIVYTGFQINVVTRTFLTASLLG